MLGSKLGFFTGGDWLMDDDVMRQWEEISKDEEDVTVTRSEDGKIQEEMVQSSPTPVVAQTQARNIEVERRRCGRLQVGSRRCWRRKQTGNKITTRRTCGRKEKPAKKV